MSGEKTEKSKNYRKHCDICFSRLGVKPAFGGMTHYCARCRGAIRDAAERAAGQGEIEIFQNDKKYCDACSSRGGVKPAFGGKAHYCETCREVINTLEDIYLREKHESIKEVLERVKKYV